MRKGEIMRKGEVTIQHSEPSIQDSIFSSFQDQQNKNEVAEVMKELFNEEKILMITDLSRDEINLSTRIKTIADLKNIPVYEKTLAYWQKLKLSQDRKSRKEILEFIRGYAGGGGFMSKLNPANWGNRGTR